MPALVTPRLFGTPPILPSEALSCWLGRIASRHRLSLDQFCKLAGLKRAIHLYDFHVDNLETRLAPLAHLIGQEPKVLTQAVRPTFRIPTGRHLRALTHRPFGQRMQPHLGYCPDCLAEDTIPYLRQSWRLSTTAVCDRHQVYLKESCGYCGLGIHPGRVQRTKALVYVSRIAAHCPSCLGDLSLCPRDKISEKKWLVLRQWQARVWGKLQGGKRRGIDVPQLEPVFHVAKYGNWLCLDRPRFPLEIPIDCRPMPLRDVVDARRTRAGVWLRQLPVPDEEFVDQLLHDPQAQQRFSIFRYQVAEAGFYLKGWLEFLQSRNLGLLMATDQDVADFRRWLGALPPCESLNEGDHATPWSCTRWTAQMRSNVGPNLMHLYVDLNKQYGGRNPWFSLPDAWEGTFRGSLDRGIWEAIWCCVKQHAEERPDDDNAQFWRFLFGFSYWSGIGRRDLFTGMMSDHKWKGCTPHLKILNTGGMLLPCGDQAVAELSRYRLYFGLTEMPLSGETDPLLLYALRSKRLGVRYRCPGIGVRPSAQGKAPFHHPALLRMLRERLQPGVMDAYLEALKRWTLNTPPRRLVEQDEYDF